MRAVGDFIHSLTFVNTEIEKPLNTSLQLGVFLSIC